MKKPQWYAADVARLGQLVIDGESTRTAAHADLSAAIGKHPEYVASLVAADAARELTRWLSDHAPAGGTRQLDMFPELPPRLKVTPSRLVPVLAMDCHDLDMARNILWARTGNAIEGARQAAERERETFTAFYDKVRPLLAGDKTVADVLGEIGGQDEGTTGGAP